MTLSIQQSEYKNRRVQLMQHMDKNSVAIIWAAPEYIRGGDSHYPYHPDSNFYYLTGFEEPHAAIVIIPGRPEGEFIFFNQENRPDLETWIGKRVGQEGACHDFGANQAYPIEQLDSLMPAFLEGKQALYFPFGKHAEWDQSISKWLNQVRQRVRSGTETPKNIIDINAILHEMRLIKSPAEAKIMHHIGQLSAAAHVKAMQATKTATHEYQIEAILWHHLAMNGCRAWAYSPIVAAGKNACVLHYVENKTALKSDELLLVDAGGEWDGYAADITRTYPINGKFSPEQKAIYELVLQSQQAAIATIKPEAPWNLAQKTIIQILTEGLVDLGILKGSVESLIANDAHKAFYMHNSGHWLGLDTHDVGNYKEQGEWRSLKAGMVLTVEPGLYIKPNKNVDSRWWNIGVRIEDDVLVTPQGCTVLTAAAPKTVDDIEQIMKG